MNDQRDNADAARVPDYYTHGASEYRRGYEDGDSAGFARGMKACYDAARKACLQLLDGVAAEDERNGKRNAALNVRGVEVLLARAIGHTLNPKGGGPCE